jgi:hypothetical protein
MHTYTALYDNRQDAEAAQQQLKGLGIIENDNANLADQNTTGFNADRSADNKAFWGGMKGGVVPEDRHIYEEGVRQGGYLLTVNVDDQHADKVEDILERSNAVDINEREEQYRQTGLLPPANLQGSQTTMGRTEGLSQPQNLGQTTASRPSRSSTSSCASASVRSSAAASASVPTWSRPPCRSRSRSAPSTWTSSAVR